MICAIIKIYQNMYHKFVGVWAHRPISLQLNSVCLCKYRHSILFCKNLFFWLDILHEIGLDLFISPFADWFCGPSFQLKKNVVETFKQYFRWSYRKYCTNQKKNHQQNDNNQMENGKWKKNRVMRTINCAVC